MVLAALALLSAPMATVETFDTFLDAGAPNENFGRDPLLTAGPNRTLLLRFANLPEGVRVKRARLMLTQVIGPEPKLTSVATVSGRWGEGPGRRSRFVAPPRLETGARSPVEAATWNARLGGLREVAWQAPGARGPLDTRPVLGLSSLSQETFFVIDGLAEVVQGWVDRPASNFGLALNFSNRVDFASSDAARGAPVLQLELDPAPDPPTRDLRILTAVPGDLPAKLGDPVRWTLTYEVLGGESGPMQINAAQGGSETTLDLPSVEPGVYEGVLNLPRRGTPFDQRTGRVRFVLSGNGSEASTQNNLLETFEVAVPATVRVPDRSAIEPLLGAQRLLQEVALPLSRFSFAPDGARTGIRLERIIVDPSAHSLPPLDALAQAAGLPRPVLGEDRWQGMFGLGDTRDDSEIPGVLGLNPEPWFDPGLAPFRIAAGRYLSATCVASLHALAETPRKTARDLFPRTSVLRLMDASGALMSGARVEAFVPGGTTPVWTIPDTRGGVAQIPNVGTSPFPNLGSQLENGLLSLRVTRNGVSAEVPLKAWQFVDAFARGNTDVALIPARVMIPIGPVLWERNLALDRLVTDSRGSSPAALAALNDGNPDTTFTWPAQTEGWIDVDLQKDRGLAAVRFEADSIWPEFRLLTYGTGQRPETASPWFTEVDSSWRARRGGLTYFGRATSVRTLRIEIPRSVAPVVLREIAVFGPRTEGP